MATHICENPECENHVLVRPGDEGTPYAHVYREGGVVGIERFLYRSPTPNTGRDFFLCLGCHTAVSMVVGASEFSGRNPWLR